jgi:hypothetical protein
MKNKPKTENWEKELNKRWYLYNYQKDGVVGTFVTCEEEVKDFIRSLILQARQEGIEMAIKKLTDEEMMEYLRNPIVMSLRDCLKAKISDCPY